MRPNLTLDFGVRYVVYPGVADVNDVLTNFVPVPYDRGRGARLVERGRHHPGGGQRRLHERHHDRRPELALRRRIHATDRNNIMPRVGFSWDTAQDGKTLVRGGYGIYYDQPLIGIFLQNAFVNPPFVTNPTVLNPLLSNPGAGASRHHGGAGRPDRVERPLHPAADACSGTSACSGSSSARASSTSATSARAATT